MIVEARTLVRCCIENLLWLGRLAAEGDKFVEDMAEDEHQSRKKRVRFILEKGPALDEPTSDTFRGISEKLNKAAISGKLLNPSEVAKGGLFAWLHLPYSILSADSAHPSLNALGRYLVRDDNTNMRGIDLLPVPLAREMSMTLHLACVALFGATATFNAILVPGTGWPGLTALEDELSALAQATGMT